MKNITIIGVGALGSHVALLLRNVDAKLKLIDFDRVESKNVLSQFHVKASIGKGKVQSLAQTMQGFFGIKVDTVPHKLTKDNVTQLLGKSDLIIDCLDNAASRILVQDFARETKAPCLHGALAPDGAYGRVVWSDKFKIDSEAGAGAATCENGEHLPFIAITSSYLAKAAQAFLADGVQVGYEITPGGSFRT